MANDLMGMFGPTPEEIQQQRQAGLMQQASRYATQSPFERAAAGMFTAGGQLGQMGAGALGMVDPQVQKAQQIQAAMGQGDADLTTSKGYFEKAKQFANIDPRIALQLTLKGKELEKQEQAAIMAANKDAREERRLEEVEKEKIRQQAELAREKLQQQAETDRRRSEDMRLSIEQRDAASKRADATDRYIAQLTAEMKRMGIEAKAAKAEQPKPLPPAIIKTQNDLLEDISAVGSANTRLDAVVKRIDDGKLSLGPLANPINRAKNAMGMSTEASRALADTKADLEKIRNDSLRLNKGTQTEGDAVRAWNEIFENMTDTKLVRRRLEDIRTYNDAALRSKKSNLDILRSEYGRGSLDTSVQERAAPTGNRQFRVLGKE